MSYLSWALPVAASGTGVTAAVTLLTTEGSSGTGAAHASLVGLLGAVGVFLIAIAIQVIQGIIANG